jgi:hypothetical protein
MARQTLQIGIVVEKRRLKSLWAGHAWLPVAVLPGVPAASPWTVLDEAAEATRFFAGPAELDFFRSETGTYRDNLQSGRPSLWVALAEVDADPGVALHSVTADPAEGEAMTESGGWIVEAVPMPPEIQETLAAFVETHHVERPFFKRKRDRADPDALGQNPARRRAQDDRS